MRTDDLLVLTFIATGFGFFVWGVVRTIATSPATVPALLTGFITGLLVAAIHRSIKHHFTQGETP